MKIFTDEEIVDLVTFWMYQNIGFEEIGNILPITQFESVLVKFALDFQKKLQEKGGGE